MVIKRLDDIEEEKHQEKRDKIKTEISEDISDVMENVFQRPKNKKLTIFGIILGILKWLGIIIIGMIIINLILGNIWLLKFFFKEFTK